MHRGWLLALASLGVLALTAAALAAGIEAWAGLYPRSPTLQRAAAWPLVGPWIGAVRERHVGPPARRDPIPPVRVVVPPRAVATAVPAGPADLPVGVWPELWLQPGDLLRARPSRAAAVVAEVSVIANVSVLAAQDEWRRVRWHGQEGWIRERPRAARPPLGSAVEPVRPVGGRVAAPELLAAAREVLAAGDSGVAGGDFETRKLGPYALLTEVDEPALLILLDRAAGAVEGAYRSRYGLALAGAPAETVVLFRRRRSYEQYLALTGGPASETGHFAGGVVALYREGRLLEDVRTTLVHELVHALGRRGLGPALPPWLDEGMADDLAESRIGASTGVEAGTVSGTTLRSGSFFEVHGGEASRELLRRELARGSLVPLARLVAMEDADFHALRPAGLGYAEASFFVRYLLAGELAAPFRGFLRDVASGVPPAPEALAAALGRSWEELDAGLAEWVREGPPPPPGALWSPRVASPEAPVPAVTPSTRR
jgi:SH3 domain-containing protein